MEMKRHVSWGAAALRDNLERIPHESSRRLTLGKLERLEAGERDLYF